jgi:hypothetical protein
MSFFERLLLTSLTYHVKAFSLRQTPRVLEGLGLVWDWTEALEDGAKPDIRALERSGHVQTLRVFAPPPDEIRPPWHYEPGDDQPVMRWEVPPPGWSHIPGDLTPHYHHAPQFAAVSRRLKRRAEQAESKEFVIVRATEKAAALTGGVAPGELNSGQLGHDLMAAELTLLHLKRDYFAWVPGQGFRKHDRRLKPPRLEGPDGIDRLVTHYAETWKGERWLLANGIALDDYTPDAALFLEGEIVRAVEWGGQYDVERLKQIHRCCASHGVSYEVW